MRRLASLPSLHLPSAAFLRVGLLVLAGALAVPAAGQNGPAPQPGPRPGAPGPTGAPPATPGDPPGLRGQQPVAPATRPTSDALIDFVLEARLVPGGAPVTAGVTWRVFPEALDAAGRLPVLAEITGGAVRIRLRPGGYLVHAAYGKAGVTKHINVAPESVRDSVVLNAGALRLAAIVGKDTPLAKNAVSFDIYSLGDEENDRTLIVGNAQPGTLLRLTAGTYNVVSRYGEANAIVRADIVVTAGKLTDATIFQRAAKLTLKLVAERGGEALANTAWSVVTPGGESVFESVGAFPTVVLAAGDYTAIAKNNGKIYESNFTVQPDVNRDVEVIAK
ncbi:MAG: hypothetical protein U1E56_04695 [Bauldia sp.]